MSFHIVTINSPQASLSCRDGQLTCKTPEGEKRLPIEDIASIIITSFSAQIHSNLFLEAARHGVALIICEAFKPVSAAPSSPPIPGFTSHGHRKIQNGLVDRCI